MVDEITEADIDEVCEELAKKEVEYEERLAGYLDDSDPALEQETIKCRVEVNKLKYELHVITMAQIVQMATTG